MTTQAGINAEPEMLFEERADFLSLEQVDEWYVKSKYFSNVHQKLKSTGAKLIVGPRGSGKTHQMKYIYTECIKDKSFPYAIYTELGKYYHLEPLLTKEAGATLIFHTWVLAKILIGIHQSISDYRELCGGFNLLTNEELNTEFDNLADINELTEFTSKIEKGQQPSNQSLYLNSLTIQKTIAIIEWIREKLQRSRTILLFDDAALSMTPTYLYEFFDVFRSLKSMKIAPKASVYPGTTQYGPRFHVGHDAEQVDCWNPASSDDYFLFMSSIIEKRIPSTIDLSTSIMELFAYASFGIPRAFIKLVRDFGTSIKNTQQQKFNEVIEGHLKSIRAEYKSIKYKAPQYCSIIEHGLAFFEHIVSMISRENQEKIQTGNTKQTTLGVIQSDEIKPLTKRMFSFLIEAGLFCAKGQVKHGGERIYDRFTPHISFLINNKAFLKSEEKGFNPESILENIKRPDEKHPCRISLSDTELQKINNSIALDMPPCDHCGTVRLTEAQSFCHNCGAKLVDKSKFEECMKISISKLPIPRSQVEKLKTYRVEKIGDLYSHQNPLSKVTMAPYIGSTRGRTILEVMNKVVQDYLG